MNPTDLSTADRLAERYLALLGLGHKFLGCSTSRELYEAIYAEASNVVGLTGFLLALYDDHRDVATVVFSMDDGEEGKAGLTYRGSDSEVLRTGTPTAIQDQSNSVGELGPEGSDADTAGSTLTVPLRWKGRVTGALTVYQRDTDAYVEDDVDLLGRFADLAAVALENMRQLEDLKRQSREAEKLEEIGRVLTSSLDFEEVLERVTSATMDLLDLDGAGIWTHKEGYGIVRTTAGEPAIPTGTTWTLSDAIAESVVEKGEPFSIEDVTAHDALPDFTGICFESGSAVSMPIMVATQVIGALSARSLKARRFSEYDVHILGRLADQASAALNNAELHASIQALSLTDALTGLANRRHLQLHLEKEVAAARRGRKLALVLFDLDSFKHYNDTLGHVVGDQILKAFGEVLDHENRAMNLVARYGGDEFVSVLSEGDAQAAEGYLGRIDEGVKAHRVLAAHGVTVSSGVALFQAEETPGVEELIQAADRSMYENKAAKR